MNDHLERRKYIRLNLVFPVAVQFFLFGQPQGRLYQGFTSNVSHNGLCIEISDLDTRAEEALHNPQIELHLTINMPLSSQSTQAAAKVVWTETIAEAFPKQYLIGIQYKHINEEARKRIFSYARRVRNVPRYVTTAMVILATITAFSLFWDYKTRHENRLLVEKTVHLASRYSELKRQIMFANQREGELKEKLQKNLAKQMQMEGQITSLRETMKQAQKQRDQESNKLLQEKEQLQEVLQEVQNKKALLERELSQVHKEKTTLTKDLTVVKKERRGLKQSTLQNMYHWLKTHQVHSTGLVTSFEGDRFLKDWAFTYDQSLSAQAFTLFGDYEKVRKIFDFYKYKAKKSHGGFVNAYEVDRGNVAEYIVHCGPNIWLAIAVLQYTNRTQDRQYMNLAESIANWVIAIQEQDKEFGIRGGPKAKWFSTEHNLDAYALFNMLHLITKQKRYQVAAQRTLRWLKTHAYSDSGPPINRGKGDSTIATDTFSWAICSLGPGRLFQSGMDPEQIIEYAEENCVVAVQYRRPEGQTIKICGFDFSKYTHSPRGGIVSAEWTAQMIVAYKTIADYFSKQNCPAKANIYRQKANFYLNELNKMLICSPSKTGQGEGCLPYATAANVDTGHGWRTPKGDRTGSLAATAFAIFATTSYNPLSLAR